MSGRGSNGRAARFEAEWRARFSRYARLHDDDASIAGWSATGLQARFRFFTHHWPDAARDGLWIDVGCGAGTYTRWLTEVGQRVVGIDYSPPSLIKARERSRDSVAWVAADATTLPLASRSVDGALCLGVTQALSDSQALIDELARILKPGGVLWVDGLNSWCIPHLAERFKATVTGNEPRVRYESPWRLRRLVRRAGFVEARLRWLPILPSSLLRAQRYLEHPVATGLLHGFPPLGALLSHSMVVTAQRGGDDARG